jgi:hypothetical protein
VAIVGRDPLAVAGMRYLLIHETTVWLRICNHVPPTAALTGLDMVIWLRVHHDGMPDLAGHVTRLCRAASGVKQLVISDALPMRIPSGPGPFSRVWLARGSESCEMLSVLLRLVMKAPPAVTPLLKKRMGRVQWRVLSLRAAGVGTRDIARICSMSEKTVSVHESALRERLGVSGRSEYAWLLRSVAQMQAAVPGLFREVHRLAKARTRTRKERDHL